MSVNLPDFIKRLVGMADKVEPSLAKIEAAVEKFKLSEEALAKANTDLKDSQAKNAELQKQLDAANTKATEQATKISGLEKDITAAKTSAVDTLAKAGVDPTDLPEAEPAATPGAKQETAWEKYCKLQASNPREAGAFYAANAVAILQSRPKA